MLVRILRPIAALAALVALAAYATIMLRGPQDRALEAKRAQIRALQEENANLSRTIQEKRQRIEKLLHDPGTQELIPEAPKMQRLGDTQFVLPDAHNPG